MKYLTVILALALAVAGCEPSPKPSPRLLVVGAECPKAVLSGLWAGGRIERVVLGLDELSRVSGHLVIETLNPALGLYQKPALVLDATTQELQQLAKGQSPSGSKPERVYPAPGVAEKMLLCLSKCNAQLALFIEDSEFTWALSVQHWNRDRDVEPPAETILYGESPLRDAIKAVKLVRAELLAVAKEEDVFLGRLVSTQLAQTTRLVFARLHTDSHALLENPWNLLDRRGAQRKEAIEALKSLVGNVVFDAAVASNFSVPWSFLIIKTSAVLAWRTGLLWGNEVLKFSGELAEPIDATLLRVLASFLGEAPEEIREIFFEELTRGISGEDAYAFPSELYAVFASISATSAGRDSWARHSDLVGKYVTFGSSCNTPRERLQWIVKVVWEAESPASLSSALHPSQPGLHTALLDTQFLLGPRYGLSSLSSIHHLKVFQVSHGMVR